MDREQQRKFENGVISYRSKTVELVLAIIDKEMANLKTGETNSVRECDNESAVLYQVRYWELHRLKEKIEAALKDKDLDEIAIDGKSYTLKQLQRYIKFYDEHQIKAGQTQCPLCECDYDENELFVCEECGNLLNKDERCKEHDHGDMTVCQECCDECREQKAFEDEVNLKIDRKRGK